MRRQLKSVDSEIDPEAKDVETLLEPRVVPVEVGLTDIEQVEIPLAVITATPRGPQTLTTNLLWSSPSIPLPWKI